MYMNELYFEKGYPLLHVFVQRWRYLCCSIISSGPIKWTVNSTCNRPHMDKYAISSNDKLIDLDTVEQEKEKASSMFKDEMRNLQKIAVKNQSQV